MDDESDKISRLEDRIEQLEATTKKMMPTRRDALKFGGAAAIGAAAMSGTASAGSAQVGTIGDASNLVDVEAEDIDVSDTLTTQDIVVNGTATGPFGGGGLFFEEGDSITRHFGDEVSIPNSSFGTVFDLASPVDIYGGNIYGEEIGTIRVTFGTNTTIQLGVFGGANSNSGEGVFPVIAMKNVKKLEWFNNDSFDRVYGYNVYTT